MHRSKRLSSSSGGTLSGSIPGAILTPILTPKGADHQVGSLPKEPWAIVSTKWVQSWARGRHARYAVEWATNGEKRHSYRFRQILWLPLCFCWK